MLVQLISFNEISNLVRIMELRQNLGFGYPEEIALNLGYIGKKILGIIIKNEFL